MSENKKQKKFDSKHIDVLLAYFGIIFYVGLSILFLIDIHLNGIFKIFVRLIFIIFPIISAIFDIYYWVKYRKETMRGRVFARRLIKDIILMVWSASLGDQMFQLDGSPFYGLFYIITLIYISLSLLHSLNAMKISIFQLVLGAFIITAASYSSVEIRTVTSLVSVIIVSILDYDFLKEVYEKYIKYRKRQPSKKDGESRFYIPKRLDTYKSKSNIRLNNLKIKFSLGIGVLNILFSILDTELFCKITNYFFTRDSALKNFGDIAWQLYIGMIRTYELVLIALVSILILAVLEIIFRNKINDFFRSYL